MRQLPVGSAADDRVELARLLGRVVEARRFISDRVVSHAATLFVVPIILLKRLMVIVANAVGHLPFEPLVLLGDEPYFGAAFADDGPYLSRLFLRLVDLRVAENLHRWLAHFFDYVL